jgi:hypothetical protein
MAKNHTDHELNQMIYEDLPSDNDSVSSIDNIDDNEIYYFLNKYFF